MFANAALVVFMSLLAEGLGLRANLQRARQSLHRSQTVMRHSREKTDPAFAMHTVFERESSNRASSFSKRQEAASDPSMVSDPMPSPKESAALELYGQRKARCMARRQLDAEFPPLATSDYAIRKVLYSEKKKEYSCLAVQHASIEQLDLQILLDVRAGHMTLQIKGEHNCTRVQALPPFIGESQCGRIRLALRNVDKRDAHGNKTRIDWPDSAFDLSIQLDGDVRFIANGHWANIILFSRKPPGVRPKLVPRTFDVRVVEAGKGALHVVAKAAQWIGYLKRLIREKINAILLDVIKHPVFQLPSDLLQGVSIDIGVKPVTPSSAKRCLDDLCVTFSQRITAAFATGKYASQESLDELCSQLAAITGVDFSPHTNHRMKVHELGALINSAQSMGLKARWEFGQQTEGVGKPFTTMTASSSGNVEGRRVFEHFRDASNANVPENFARDHPVDAGWHTLAISGGATADSKQFALGIRGPAMETNANLRLTQAELDGNPVWAFGFNARGASFSAQQLVLQVVGEGAGEQLEIDKQTLDLTLDLFRPLGSEVKTELKVELWVSGALDMRTGKVSFCIVEPCGGLIETIKPTSVTLTFTSPVLTVKFRNAEWTLRLHFRLFLVRATDYMKRVAILKCLHGSVDAGRVEGVERVRRYKQALERLERDYASANGTYAADRSRILILGNEDANIFAWQDEELDAKLALRVRPADSATLNEICSENGDSIMELTSDTGGPAEFTLTLKDPISSDRKLWLVLSTAVREEESGQKLLTVRLKAHIRLAISNGELQGCQCPNCANAVKFDALSVVDRPGVSLLLQGASLFLQDWITNKIGMFLPVLLRPVVSSALARHQIKDSQATLSIGIKTKLGSDMVEVSVNTEGKIKIESRGMAPNMGAVVPKVSVEAIDGLIGITQKFMAIAARRILNDLKIMVPAGGSVSMSVHADLKNDLSFTYQISDVKVDAEANAIFRNSAILAAQPPLSWKETLADLGLSKLGFATVASDQLDTTAGLDDFGLDGKSNESGCFFQTRPPSLLHKPREMMALKENVAFDRWVIGGTLECTSTLQRTHDFQHVFDLHHRGDLVIGLHDVMRTLFNDPGMEDFGYIDTTFKNFGPLQGSGTNRSFLEVEVACGSIFVEKTFVRDVGAEVDVFSMSDHPGGSHTSSKNESEKSMLHSATPPRRCVIIHAPTRGDVEICSEADQVSNLISTVKAEANRQLANDALWSSDECRHKLSQFPMTPAFSWKGIREARRCMNLDQWRSTGKCVKACGDHPPCQSVRFVLHGPTVLCKYSAFPGGFDSDSASGATCEISKDWWVMKE